MVIDDDLNNLVMAIKMGDIDKCLELIDDPQTDCNYIDYHDHSMIMLALRKGLPSIALKLLDNPDINYNHIKKDECSTALIWACEFGHDDVALKILSKDGNGNPLYIDYVDLQGHSALYYAIHKDMKNVLIRLEELYSKYNVY
jgi:ankyrin repeat protein